MVKLVVGVWEKDQGSLGEIKHFRYSEWIRRRTEM